MRPYNMILSSAAIVFFLLAQTASAQPPARMTPELVAARNQHNQRKLNLVEAKAKAKATLSANAL